MICSTGKDLICLPHIKIRHSLHTSSTVPNKPSVTTTTKLLPVLGRSAEATVSRSVTFCIISLTAAASPVLVLSRDQVPLTSTAQWKRSHLPVFCSLVTRQTRCCGALSRGRHKSELTHAQLLGHHLERRAASQELLQRHGSLPAARQSRHISQRH